MLRSESDLGHGITLAIVGAGPKAAAIAAKAAALSSVGLANIRVCVIEAKCVAANWDGKNGFTNGSMYLGTNPEKDCGFPYDCKIFENPTLNEQVNEAMLAYSWQAFNVDRRTYSEWIDRGRPAPTHQQFAAYLKWVFERSKPLVVNATVHRILPTNRSSARLLIEAHSPLTGFRTEKDVLKTRDNSLRGITDLLALPVDGVVLSGPGSPYLIQGVERFNTPFVLNGENYWQHEREFDGLRDEVIGVFGGGETAATVLLSLIEHTHSSCRLELISASGLIYTRGEGFHENQIYSDPEKWQEIDEIRRPDVIRRTDRGVFSVHARERIDQCDRIQVLKGYVDSVKRREDRIAADIRFNGPSGQCLTTRFYDRVIIARGFDPWSLPMRLLPNHLGEMTNRKELQAGIDRNLRLPIEAEMNVHVPALAGLAQGPGFMNLSCLGTLADRILELYVKEGA